MGFGCGDDAVVLRKWHFYVVVVSFERRRERPRGVAETSEDELPIFGVLLSQVPDPMFEVLPIGDVTVVDNHWRASIRADSSAGTRAFLPSLLS